MKIFGIPVEVDFSISDEVRIAFYEGDEEAPVDDLMVILQGLVDEDDVEGAQRLDALLLRDYGVVLED